MDISTPENLNNLVNIGRELLSHQASRVDPETGNLSPILNMGSNRDVLIRLYYIFKKSLIFSELEVSFSNLYAYVISIETMRVLRRNDMMLHC